MKKNKTRPHQLAMDLTQLLNLKSDIDTILSVSMYHLNKYMNSERSSIFLFDPVQQQLTSYSSLDLDKQEIRMSKTSGVAGWVFNNRMPAVINDAYADRRFYRGVDDMTGFRTSNLICTPLMDEKENCLGTLQSLNKKSGHFTIEDLNLLNHAARLVAATIEKCGRNVDSLTSKIPCRDMKNGISTKLATIQ